MYYRLQIIDHLKFVIFIHLSQLKGAIKAKNLDGISLNALEINYRAFNVALGDFWGISRFYYRWQDFIVYNTEKNRFFITKIQNSPIKSHTNIYSLIKSVTKQLLNGPIKKIFRIRFRPYRSSDFFMFQKLKRVNFLKSASQIIEKNASRKRIHSRARGSGFLDRVANSKWEIFWQMSKTRVQVLRASLYIDV